MKNELGIEVKCENCFCLSDIYKNHCMLKDAGKDCKKNNFKKFLYSWESMEARIKELQEQVEELESENNGLNEYYQQQQFTEDELCLMECLVRFYVMIHKITDDKSPSKTLLKKIEQISKNSEANLKEQE